MIKLKIAPRKAGLAASMLATAGAVILLTGRSPAVEPPAGLQLAAPAPGPVIELPIDTPPALRPASGWPFEQLPMVAKFEVPVPRLVALVSPARPVFIGPTPLRLRPLQEDDPISTLWLLPPLAAGAAYGSAYQDVPNSVVPEPSSLLLLGTGLAIGALRARRRRR